MLGEKDDYFSTSKSLIEDLESRKKIAIVSYTLILEVVDTMRRKIIKTIDFSGDTRKECNSKKFIVEEKISSFIKKIYDYSESKKIMIIKPCDTISEHQKTILKKFLDYFGYVRVMSRCSNCDGVVPRDFTHKCPKCNEKIDLIKKYQYKGLGYIDLEHAYLAKFCNSSIFYTSDTSFESLNNDPDFQSIKFRIIQHPSKLKTY